MILCFFRMRSERFPFIVWRSGGLGAGPLFASSCSSRRRGVVVASSSRRHGIVNTVSMGETAKPQSLLVLWRRRVYGGSCHASLVLLRSPCLCRSCKTLVSACPLHLCCEGSCETSFVLLRSRRRVFWGSCKTSLVLLRSRRDVYEGSCKTSVSACLLASPCLLGKLQPQSRLEFLLLLWRLRVYGGSCKTSFVLLRSRRRVYGGSCKTSVSACLLASPCLWGKLQNLSLVSSFCFSSGVAVSMGEAAKHRSFCCAHVAVSMGEAAKPQSLLVFWRLRVYGGSSRTSVSSRVSASPLASPCLWGKLQNIVRSAALTSPCRGSCKTSVSACLLASHEPFHYLILDRYGQIDSCSHDIVDVRPTGCLVNACDLPFYLFHPFSDPSCQRASPALSAQSRKATLLASIFQHLSTACLLFFAFFYEKGRIRFKMKKKTLLEVGKTGLLA